MKKGADRSAPFMHHDDAGFYLTEKSLLATDWPLSETSTL